MFCLSSRDQKETRRKHSWVKENLCMSMSRCIYNSHLYLEEDCFFLINTVPHRHKWEKRLHKTFCGSEVVQLKSGTGFLKLWERPPPLRCLNPDWKQSFLHKTTKTILSTSFVFTVMKWVFLIDFIWFFYLYSILSVFWNCIELWNTLSCLV